MALRARAAKSGTIDVRLLKSKRALLLCNGFFILTTHVHTERSLFTPPHAPMLVCIPTLIHNPHTLPQPLSIHRNVRPLEPIPVIGSIARGDQRLNCSMERRILRSRIEPREQK